MRNIIKMPLTLACVSVLAACMPEIEHRQTAPLMVDTFTVAEAAESQFRNFNAMVMPAELTPLAFRIEGEIASILVKEGDKVQKGQVVAILDDSKSKQQLIDAQVRFELALKQAKRGEELKSNKMISSAELDELQASLQLAEANLGLAKSAMRYMRLKAPFNGVISSVDKKKFENVTPGEQVVSIYQDDQVYVKIEVSDSVLAMLSPDSHAQKYQPTAIFSGHEGRYSLSYLEHTSELHPSSQTYQVWLKMAQIDKKVLPGTSAKVTVDLIKAGLNTHQAYQLPMTAIDSGRETQAFHVWKLEDGAAHRYPISVDQITGTGALVADGLKEGDVLINSNLRKLREGMEIKGVKQ